MTDADFLTRIINASVRMSQEVVTPFPNRGTGDAIAKLRKKEKRLREMCKEGVIAIMELKRDQAAIRGEIARLEAFEAPTQTCNPRTVQELTRLIVKGAMRFKNIKSTHEQRALLESLFAEVFFRDDSIGDFRLHPHLVASMGDGGEELAQTIHLETAFRLTPPQFQITTPAQNAALCSIAQSFRRAADSALRAVGRSTANVRKGIGRSAAN